MAKRRTKRLSSAARGLRTSAKVLQARGVDFQRDRPGAAWGKPWRHGRTTSAALEIGTWRKPNAPAEQHKGAVGVVAVVSRISDLINGAVVALVMQGPSEITGQRRN